MCGLVHMCAALQGTPILYFRDLLSVETVSTINAGLCHYHLAHCPPSQQMLDECTVVSVCCSRPGRAQATTADSCFGKGCWKGKAGRQHPQCMHACTTAELYGTQGHWLSMGALLAHPKCCTKQWLSSLFRHLTFTRRRWWSCARSRLRWHAPRGCPTPTTPMTSLRSGLQPRSWRKG